MDPLEARRREELERPEKGGAVDLLEARRREELERTEEVGAPARRLGGGTSSSISRREAHLQGGG